MSIYRDQISSFSYEQTKLLEIYENELKASENGHLVSGTSKGKTYYYQSINENGKEIRKPLTKHPEIINALARKEFLKQSIIVLKSNIELLKWVETHYKDESLEALKGKMHKAYRELPSECFLTSEWQGAGIYRQRDENILQRHIAWANEPYEQSTYRPEGRRYPTSAGIMVRSKSEQHIVEQLVNYGVPFRYEQLIKVNDSTFSADFTFEAADKSWFFWEHAGMMDIDYYRSNHKRKMYSYESVGIVPWDNLIVTYDVNDIINVPMIKSIIENEVIPRL